MLLYHFQFFIIDIYLYAAAKKSRKYLHYFFNAIDRDRKGKVSFDVYVRNLSIILRGSLDEKLRWIFLMFHVNCNGYFTRRDLGLVINAVYEPQGRFNNLNVRRKVVPERVDAFFKVNQIHSGLKIMLYLSKV